MDFPVFHFFSAAFLAGALVGTGDQRVALIDRR
jgi:hypothetical protein